MAKVTATRDVTQYRQAPSNLLKVFNLVEYLLNDQYKLYLDNQNKAIAINVKTQRLFSLTSDVSFTGLKRAIDVYTEKDIQTLTLLLADKILTDDI